MNEETKGAAEPSDEQRAERKARGERYSQMMWAYVCGAITLLCNAVGLEASFIPLGFGVLGLILCWQLSQKNERRHPLIAGAINLGGIMIWLTYTWPWLSHAFVR